jgi:hypothetical protein
MAGMTAPIPAVPDDPRAAVEYRVPAVELRVGDLVNTSPGEDDWQQVIGVYRTAADVPVSDAVRASDAAVGTDAADNDNDNGDGVDARGGGQLRTLVESLNGRYVVVQLTDVAPVDSGVYFAAGVAMVYGGDESSDQAVADVVSGEDGTRTYLYTRFELVTVRAAARV